MSLEDKKTILLVEDDQFTAMATKMQVQRFGYNVVLANSGEEAIKMAIDNNDISLILMDIDLGGIDGTEAAREILAVRHIPIVFLTSHTEEDYVKRVKEITRYGYVVKNSGAFVLKSSIEMAFELFNEYQKTKESEERHRLLFETMSPGVVYQTADGKIISANPSAERLLGLTLKQMQGKTSTDPRWRMITEEGIELKGTEHPAMIALKTGQKVGPAMRGVFIPEKNEYVWIYVTAIPLFRPGEDKPYQVYATFEDITERKQAEDKVKALQRLLQDTGKLAKVGGWELDAKTLEVSWTEQTYHIHEVPLDYKPPLQEAINFYHPDDRQKLSKALERAINNGEPFDLELRFITAKGNHLFVHAICNPQIKDGEVVKLTGTFQDITERKKAEKMLLKNKQLLQNIVDTSPFHIVCLDCEGKYTVANRSYCESFGIPTDKIEGLHYSQVLPPMLLQRHKPFIERAISGEIVRFEDANPPGGKIPEYAYGVYTPIRDKMGNIQGCVVYVADITETKKVQQALEKSEKKLRQLNDTKDKFFSIIAHDLKSPLGAFQSGIEILIEHLQYTNDEYAKKISNSLYKTALQVYEFLENLLEWSRFQWGLMPNEPKKIDLTLLANYVLDLLSDNAKQKHIDLQCLIKQETFVYADYDMVQNILNNLISNAIKFTRDGGKILIDAKETGDFMEVSVTDTGVGITPEKIERLFKAGEQKISTLGTEGERGTGLGLILCKEFVEKNGGSIWVESQIDMGSSLKFTLPLCKPIFE